jgi:hypothetical protein
MYALRALVVVSGMDAIENWELNTEWGVVLTTSWRKRGQHLRTLTTEKSGLADGC